MHLWILKDLYRRKVQTLIKIALSFLLLFFLFIFCNNIQRNQRELQNIYDTYEVKMILRCVEDEEKGVLDLTEEELRQAEHDEFVKNVSYIAKVSIDTLKTDLWSNQSESIRVFLQEELDTLNAQYLVGDDTKGLTDNEYIASEFWDLNASAITFEWEGKEVLYEGTKKSNCLENSIYIPYSRFEQICRQLDLPFSLDIAVYSLKNTRELDQYRAYLNQQPIILEKKCEYFIFDGVLQDATRPLKQIIAMMEVFLPIVFGLIAVIAFFISYVACRAEQRVLFLMYTLGVKKWKRFCFVWAKEMLCCLISILPGMLLLDMKYIGFYLLSFGLGSGISALRMVLRVNNTV